MISTGAWVTFPILTYFWLYKGYSFWKSLIFFLLSEFVFQSFRVYGLFQGLYAILIVASAFWVYGNAKRNKVKMGWLFAIVAFIFPIIGLIPYFIFKEPLSKIKVEKIETPEGKIKIFNEK